VEIFKPDASGYVLVKDKWFWIITFLCIIILFVQISFFYDFAHELSRGYNDGYTCAQDTFQNPEDRTEGFYDYWLNGGFWFQQGYEEGYKRGARDYVKENGKN
jgi:hypothetical protein